MRKYAFYFLCFVCIPFFLLGLFAYMLPVLLVRGKVSGTTYEPFNARVTWDMLGLRPDPAARRLARALPATNLLTRLVVFRLLTVLCRITGFVSPALAYPAKSEQELSAMVAVRTQFFDDAMTEQVRAGDQVVILGAGWDTRAYGLLTDRQVRIFEVDAPATQRVKLNALSRCGLQSDEITFVACDFNRESWLNMLEQAGFTRGVRTFILWEGVSMYLTEQAVHETLEAVTRLAPGSMIAFDFLPAQWWLRDKLGRASAKSIRVTYGEEFDFHLEPGIDVEQEIKDLLAPHQLAVHKQIICRTEGDQATAFYGMVLAGTNAANPINTGD